VPTSLLGAAATSLTAVAGWLLDRRAGWTRSPITARTPGSTGIGHRLHVASVDRRCCIWSVRGVV